jgi:hypothetical protein
MFSRMKTSFAVCQTARRALDAVAAAMWFVIPISLAGVVALGAPIWLAFPNKYCFWAYWVGTILSVAALICLGAVLVLPMRTRNG